MKTTSSKSEHKFVHPTDRGICNFMQLQLKIFLILIHSQFSKRNSQSVSRTYTSGGNNVSKLFMYSGVSIIYLFIYLFIYFLSVNMYTSYSVCTISSWQ